MNSIDVSDATYEKLLVAASLMGCTVGRVVDQMVSNLSGSSDPAEPLEAEDESASSTSAESSAKVVESQLPVHKIYKSTRIEGIFNVATHEVRVITEPWNHRVFPSPTAAAVAVVEHFSGDVRTSSNTNGRKFWKVTSTGRDLRSIIGER